MARGYDGASLPDRRPAQYRAAMSGYVASARIDRRSTRLAARSAPPKTRANDDRSLAPSATWIETPPVDIEPGPLVTRWIAFRERWSQLRFFLTDPNSWR